MRLFKIILIILVMVIGVYGLCQFDINRLKAAYTEKFTSFIEWPISNQDEFFRIGYYDEDEYIGALKEYLSNSEIKNQSIEFLKIESDEMILRCDMICVDDPDIATITTLLKYIENNPVLIVSHGKDNALAGLHINFYIEDDRLKFEMNPTALKQSGFKTSYHLLKLARLVPEENQYYE